MTIDNSLEGMRTQSEEELDATLTFSNWMNSESRYLDDVSFFAIEHLIKYTMSLERRLKVLENEVEVYEPYEPTDAEISGY
jgi:hypothetical protein